MGYPRRLAIGAISTAAVGTAAQSLPPAAEAYTKKINNCNDSSITWFFENHSLWTSSKQSWVRSGINDLQTPLDYDGSKLITMTEHSSTAVQIKDKPLGEYGSSECVFGASFWVNSNYSSSSFYRRVGRHEMFHLAGAEHGGQHDSFDGLSPSTMATCLSASLFSNSGLEQDGAAYANFLHSSLSNRQLHANVGFEQGFSYWGRSSGAGPVTEHGSGGATGPGHIRYKAVDVGDYLFQTIRAVTGNDNETFRAVANARSLSSNYKTVVGVNLYRRTVNFPNNSPNGCQYPAGIVDPNGSPSVGGWVRATGGSAEVGTGWTQIKSNDPSEWINPPTAEGMDFQVRLNGSAVDRTTNDPQYFAIDNVRGEST